MKYSCSSGIPGQIAALVAALCLSSSTVAFNDPSTISDQTFFGVWNGTGWTTVGKINYGYNSDPTLASVEVHVKLGNYASAKTTLLSYFANRSNRESLPLVAADRNTVQADLFSDDIFGVLGETYLDSVTVTNSYQTVTANVLSGVQLAMTQDKNITFLLIDRLKDGASASFYSREQSTNKPNLVLQVDGSPVTLYATKDTYVRGLTYGDTNYGTATSIVVKDTGFPYDSSSRRGYVAFDLSSITGTITSASLNLYGYNSAGTGNKAVMVLQSPNTSWSETALTWNTMLSGVFSWQGVSTSTDWNLPSGGADGQWLNFVTRLPFAKTMAYEYNQTSTEAYASDLIRLLLDYIGDKGNSNPGYYLSIDAGIRAQNWVVAYDYIKSSSSMDSGANTGFLKYLWSLGNYLGDEDNEYPEDTQVFNDASYHATNNWGIIESAGLYTLAVYFPELTDSAAWKTLAEKRLEYLMKTLNYSDSSFLEAASNYTLVALRYFLNAKLMADANSLAFTETLDAGIQRMAVYSMNSSFPSGFDPQYGDSDATDNRPTYSTVAGLYGNQNLEYVATSGVSGTVPPYTSIAYPDSRRTIMRSGWGANDLYMHMAGFTGSHGHTDIMGLIAYGHGRPLLIDPGRHTYDGDSISLWLQRSTEAHNTIEINDTAQSLSGTVNKNNTTTDWYTNGLFDFYEGFSNAYANFVHNRAVLFVRPKYWIVSDHVTSATGTNKFEQNWHFLPEAQISLDGTSKSVSSNFSSGADIQVVPADPTSLTASIASGYYSAKYKQVADADYAAFVKNVAGDTTFDTVLYPTASGDNRTVGVTRLTTGVATTTATAIKADLSVGANGNLGYYYLSHEANPTTARSFDTYNFNGKMAYVETDYLGNVKAANLVRGSTLKKGGVNWVNSSMPVPDIGVKWEGTTVEISGTSLKHNTSTSTAIAIYAPSATSVKLNGTSVGFTQSGNYIYAAGQSKIQYRFADQFDSTQGTNGWNYQALAGTTYTNLVWSSTYSRWENSGAVPFIAKTYQSPGSSHDGVVKWTVPAAGFLSVKGSIASAAAYTNGDGTNVRVTLNGSNVWPTSGWQYIAKDDTTGYTFNKAVSVASGDVVEFVVNRYGNADWDNVKWTIDLGLYPGGSGVGDDFEDGNANDWTPLNASRWTVGTDSGDYSYFINTTNYSNQSGNRPGEYALLNGSNYGSFELNVEARLGDAVAGNSAADLVLVFNYQDASNYYYFMLNNDLSFTQLFKVKAGARILIADSDGKTDWVNDNNYHELSVIRNKTTGEIKVILDGKTVLQALDTDFTSGQVGIGSFNDSAYFDNFQVIWNE